MCEQNIRSRNINEKDQLQQPCKLLTNLLRRFNSLVDQPAFAADTQRVQNVEQVVPQPRDEAWRVSAQSEHKVRVSYYLRHAPRNQHTGVSGALGEEGESVHDAPNEEKAASNLHGSGAYGGSYETNGSMHHFQYCQGLRPFAESPYAWINSPKSNKWHKKNDSPKNRKPEDSVHEIVEDEVLRLGRAGLERFGPWLSHSSNIFLGSHLQISWISIDLSRIVWSCVK